MRLEVLLNAITARLGHVQASENTMATTSGENELVQGLIFHTPGEEAGNGEP